MILSDDWYTFKKSEIDTIHLQIFNPYPFQINLMHKELPVVFQIAFVKNGYMEVKKNLKLPDHISSSFLYRGVINFPGIPSVLNYQNKYH